MGRWTWRVGGGDQWRGEGPKIVLYSRVGAFDYFSSITNCRICELFLNHLVNPFFFTYL